MSHDPAEFFRNVAKKRMGAGALLFDAQGGLLVVQPTYKETWEIPGGVVELDESPRRAALREIEEEIGLHLPEDRLRLVGLEYMAAGDVATEALMFVFHGGTLDEGERAAIRLDPEELRSCGFFPLAEAARLLGPVLGPRVERCVRSDGFLYTEGRYL